MTVRLVNGRECWDLEGGGDKFSRQSRELGEKLFVGKKNSGWNSVSAGVVALRTHIAMPSLGAEFGHLH